jgi:DNA repair protein RadC
MRASDDLIVEHARRCIAAKYARGTVVTNPAQLHEFLRMQIGLRDHEVFAVLLLDNARRIIDYVELFHGTIDTTEVHVRSVLQCVVQSRADEIVLLHNHPRGNPKPSQADRAITDRLDRALKMVDVRILDHVIVGESMYSFVSHGLLRH